MPTGKKAPPAPITRAAVAILRAHANDKELSQPTLERLTGISQTMISKLWRGVSVMDVNQLELLSKALGLRVSDVVIEAERVVNGVQEGIVIPFRKSEGTPTITEEEALELGAVAKTEESVISVDEEDDGL